mmetsp:Transcript_144/g.517  ORF Transcript_144/g.517 Transcript_144/m.517 type:complete len:513 (-) Transcript_144:383-1921(-)|eukprot:CAMPEP_0117447672 /NCGR_PEP_ID=MMETSP0759-20121206/6999_1 /TAXON_ID=63605 /ORGANISM="Percolomonas cosmopolitus, Strain WS" /LENGTH=512 /DNA_ID=CAMNT_0005240021 /DNA_START=199 /DNA_END=1737 /DNA_ORIENTATION=-
MFEDSFTPFPQFDEPADSNNHLLSYSYDDGLGDLAPFDTEASGAPFSSADDLPELFHISSDAEVDHNSSNQHDYEHSASHQQQHQQQQQKQQQHSYFHNLFTQPSLPSQKQDNNETAPFSRHSLPQVRTTRHMLISQGSSSSLNSACDSPVSASMNSANAVMTHFQKAASQQQRTPQTPQKSQFTGFGGGPTQYYVHQQTPEKLMDEQMQQYFRHQQQLHSYSTFMQSQSKLHDNTEQYFNHASVASHFPQHMHLHQRPYFPSNGSTGSVTSPSGSDSTSSQSTTHQCIHNGEAQSASFTSPEAEEDKVDSTKSRSPVSQPKSPISPTDAGSSKSSSNRKKKPAPIEVSIPSTPAGDVLLSSPRSIRRKTLEEKVADAERVIQPLVSSENTPNTPNAAKVTCKRSKSTSSATSPQSAKSKAQMPCSIIGCKRLGSRLMESLKGALDQQLKDNPSGRVCEAHYRQDLRAHKKNSRRSLHAEFANTSEQGAATTKKRKADSSSTTRSSKRAKKS